MFSADLKCDVFWGSMLPFGDKKTAKRHCLLISHGEESSPSGLY